MEPISLKSSVSLTNPFWLDDSDESRHCHLVVPSNTFTSGSQSITGTPPSVSCLKQAAEERWDFCKDKERWPQGPIPFLKPLLIYLALVPHSLVSVTLGGRRCMCLIPEQRVTEPSVHSVYGWYSGTEWWPPAFTVTLTQTRRPGNQREDNRFPNLLIYRTLAHPQSWKLYIIVARCLVKANHPIFIIFFNKMVCVVHLLHRRFQCKWYPDGIFAH